ncbi:hypothetical protein LEP1GSC043_2220 [Leptospira weilii str. Ecochallenge]|uniref:Uncharacterized protein n=1 Tax=Leptospira weilii str. Ecochallenge TaxID=1049986 RepID=N1U4J5_9LEPT|nr:hypothetical protein LEP1GSC043_2220 [Leptospira weilii str. Ecochallenge]
MKFCQSSASSKMRVLLVLKMRMCRAWCFEIGSYWKEERFNLSEE